MNNTKPIYLFNREDPKEIAILRKQIIEKHRGETVIFRNSIPVENPIDDYDDFAEYNLSVSAFKTVDGKELVIDGTEGIYRKLLDDNDEKEIIDIQMGYIGLSVPFGASSEDEVEFNYFPSINSLVRFMKEGRMSYYSEGWEKNDNNMIFLYSYNFCEMTRENAVKFLSQQDYEYINRSSRVNCRFFVFRAEPMRIMMNSMNKNCGRGKSIQRIYYLFESIRNWARNLMSNSWIEIKTSPNARGEFTYTRKIFSQNQKEGSGIRPDFITRKFSFASSFYLCRFFLPDIDKDPDLKCRMMIDFLNRLDFDLSINNFSGTLSETNIIFDDFHNDEKISERLVRSSENRAVKYLQKQNPVVAEKVMALTIPKPKSRQNPEMTIPKPKSKQN